MASMSQASDRYQNAATKCPSQVSAMATDDQLVRRAMSAYVMARGAANDSWIWSMPTAQLLSNVFGSGAESYRDPEIFARKMMSKRHLAFNADCTFNSAVFGCLVQWYADPANEAAWQGPTASLYPPDSVLASCLGTTPDRKSIRDTSSPILHPGQGDSSPPPPLGKIDPSQLWPGQKVIPGATGPGPYVIGTLPNWWQQGADSGSGPDEAAGSGAGADTVADEQAAPKKSNTLLWVGILSVLGVAGVGVWYLSKQPSPNPTRKTRCPHEPTTQLPGTANGVFVQISDDLSCFVRDEASRGWLWEVHPCPGPRGLPIASGYASSRSEAVQAAKHDAQEHGVKVWA